MAEMQRKKKGKTNKKTESIDILTDVLNEVTTEKLPQKKLVINSKVIEMDQKSPSETKTEKTTSTITTQTITQEPKTILEKQEPIILESGKLHPLVKPVLPSWINKPWRWMIPNDPELKSQWLITWGEFMLDFARVLNFHILDLQEVALVYPFQNSLLKKKLTYPQLNNIAEYLIEIEKAEWWDDEQTRLRIYWKTLTTFAEELYNYAFQHGYDMVTAYDIVKMKQPWSSLPPSDIRMLMKIMVEAKKASWADSDRKTIEFIYD